MAEEEKQQSGLMSPAVGMAVEMTDRFANPAKYFQQAREEGRQTFLPIKFPEQEEVEQLKTTVPEKLKEIDSPYLSEKAKEKLIEKYQKGEGPAQKAQLAFPAAFEIPQLDLLFGGPKNALTTKAFNPIRALDTFSKNMDVRLTSEVESTLINQTAPASRPLTEELLNEYKKTLKTDDLSNSTVERFKNFIQVKYEFFKPASGGPSTTFAELGLPNMLELYSGKPGVDAFVNKYFGDIMQGVPLSGEGGAGNTGKIRLIEDRLNAKSVAVKMKGTSYIPYRKSFTGLEHSGIERPPLGAGQSPYNDGANFGHYRHFDYGKDGFGVHELQTNDAFKPYYVLYTSTNVGAPDMMGRTLEVIKSPTQLETQAILAAYKMFGGTAGADQASSLIQKLNNAPDIPVRGQSAVNEKMMKIISNRAAGMVVPTIKNIRKFTNGAYDEAKEFGFSPAQQIEKMMYSDLYEVENFTSLQNKSPSPQEIALAAFQLAFSDDAVTRLGFENFKRKYGFLLEQGELTLPEKAFAAMSTNPKAQNHQVMLAAIEEAKLQDKKFILFPKPNTANKVNMFTSNIKDKFKIPFVQELLKDSPQDVQAIFRRGFFNGPEYQRNVVFNTTSTGGNNVLDLYADDIDDFINHYSVLNENAHASKRKGISFSGGADLEFGDFSGGKGANLIAPEYVNIAFVEAMHLATKNKLLDVAEYRDGKKFNNLQGQLLSTPENLNPVYGKSFKLLKKPFAFEFKKEIAEKILTPELVLSMLYNYDAGAKSKFSIASGSTGYGLTEEARARILKFTPAGSQAPKKSFLDTLGIKSSSMPETKLGAQARIAMSKDTSYIEDENIFMNILRPLNKALVPDSKNGYFATNAEMYEGIQRVLQDKNDFLKSNVAQRVAKKLLSPYEYMLGNKYLNMETNSYPLLKTQGTLLESLYKNLKEQKFLAKVDNTGEALKKTNVLPIMKNYYEYPVKLFNDANIKYTDFTDEIGNSWYRVELDDVSIDLLDNYKVKLFSEVTLPRFTDKEED